MVMQLGGIWIPIITPFYNGEIDFASYKELVEYYISNGIAGLIPVGTTGESPTISDYELEQLTEKTLEYSSNRIHVFIGVGGNYTNQVVNRLKLIEKYPIEGILSLSPYFNNPNQVGIYEHYKRIAESTSKNILIYNIPYRTSVNIENKTIYKLAEIKNIIGMKDSSGNLKQTMELLLGPPSNFKVFAGDDVLFYSMLELGAVGAILASAHILPNKFVDIYTKVQSKDNDSALGIWKALYPIIPSLFKEPSPAPIKYCLERAGLIRSRESRLPIVDVSDTLKEELNKLNIYNN
jgi:4-hydroxy-tetrahydrodipicolinate synthase